MTVAPSPQVLKFGGSSLGDATRLLHVVERIRAARETGPVSIVVSALGETTDRLIEAFGAAAGEDLAAAHRGVDALEAEQRQLSSDVGAGPLPPALTDDFAALRSVLAAISVSRDTSAAMRDEVMSYGERTSACFVAHVLTQAGLAAAAVDARFWLQTNDHFGDADVDLPASRRRFALLAAERQDRIHVHTGFLGATLDGRTTTLGRNGSDYTAALIANFLGAAELVRWTDVPGVMTADPRVVGEAYTVPQLSHAEALELSSLGWGVLHPRTLLPLIEAGIPLRILSTLDPDGAGTVIDARGSADADRPTCVTSVEALALVSVDWRRREAGGDIGPGVLEAVARADVPVFLAVQQPQGRAVTLAVPQSRLPDAERALRASLASHFESDLAVDVVTRAPVTLIALVAEAMGQNPNVAGRFYGALGSVGIQVRAAGQGAAMRSVVAVVDGADTPAALRTVHAAMNLAHEEVSLFILGVGVVGSALLAQIETQAPRLRAVDGIALRIVGLADSKRQLFGDDLGSPSAARTRLETQPAAPRPLTLEDLTPTLDRLARLPAPVLIDVTAADGMEHLYAAAWRRGIHVVAANKKPLALPQAERDRLIALARQRSRAYRYETTVGAGLPVIETLKDLVRTGDRVRRIEGSLSGTLGFLTGQLMAGVPLSVAVRDARARGYTEPHPREDLGGKDAGRKALILARELGYSIEATAVNVEPLAPEAALAEDDLDRFYAALAREDAAMATRIDGLKREGRVLRYLARLEVHEHGVSVEVGPAAVPSDHVAAHLRGAEAFVAFTTERYAEYPLTVRGAGAGGPVTAAGVLADILRVAQTLRGR